MEANHTLRNALSSDLDLPKSKIFPSALNLKFLFSRVVTPITIALAKFRSPACSVTPVATVVLKPFSCGGLPLNYGIVLRILLHMDVCFSPNFKQPLD